MERSTAYAFIACVLCLLTPGCERIKSFIDQAKQEAAEKEETEQKNTADDDLGEKLDKYIECINNASGSASDSADRYYTWVVDKAKGPTGAERNVYGLYELRGVDECKKAVGEAKGMQPSLPELEKAGEDFAAAMSELAPLVKEAHTYYDQANYKDDKMAKGKELHPKLASAFDKVNKADEVMRVEFDKHKDAHQQRQLDRLKKEGHELGFRHLTFMIQAKKLVRLCSVPLKENGPNIQANLDMPKFQPQMDAAAAAYKELDDYAGSHKAETDKVMMFGSFLSAANDFLKEAKEMMRITRDNGTIDRFQAENMPEMAGGHPAKVSKLYNDMINRSNSLHW
jgi:uncharacterized protein DUF3829